MRILLVTVVVTGLVALLAGILVDASGSAHRQSGSNLVMDRGFVAVLPPGEGVCQFGFVPADTAGVRVHAVASGPVSLSTEVDDQARVVATGTVNAAPSGTALIPLRQAVRRPLPATARVCIVNHGQSKVSLGGMPTPAARPTRVGTTPQRGVVRIEFTRPGQESWWQLLPTLVHRFGVAKSHWLGGWSLFLAALLTLVGSVIVVRTLLSEERL